MFSIELGHHRPRLYFHPFQQLVMEFLDQRTSFTAMLGLERLLSRGLQLERIDRTSGRSRRCVGVHGHADITFVVRT